MKKMAFVLFVAILGLGMTGLASAVVWDQKIVVIGDTYNGPLNIGPDYKVKIVFKPGSTDYDQLTLDWGTADGIQAAVAAGSQVKVKIAGQGVVDANPVSPVNFVGQKVKLKLIGQVGNVQLTSASLSNGAAPNDPPTAAPEPASMLLLGSGLVGMAAVGRRKFFKK